MPATGVQTDLQAELLLAWATWANDPAAPAARWLADGAPAAINVNFELDGVLEPITEENAVDSESLSTDYGSFTNYGGVESDLAALEIIDG